MGLASASFLRTITSTEPKWIIADRVHTYLCQLRFIQLFGDAVEAYKWRFASIVVIRSGNPRCARLLHLKCTLGRSSAAITTAGLLALEKLAEHFIYMIELILVDFCSIQIYFI